MMTLKERVYNFISSQLTLGELKRSDRITEQYLVDNLGISRTPVREALLQLAADGILEHEPRKGYAVKNHSKRDVEELYVVIGVLDGKVATLALPFLEQTDYAMMNFLIGSMDSAIENGLYTKYNELQSQFHDVYMAKCPNQLLCQELLAKKKIFIGKSYNHMDKETTKEQLLATNQEHKKILELFKIGKTAALRQYIEEVHWVPQHAQYDIW